MKGFTKVLIFVLVSFWLMGLFTKIYTTISQKDSFYITKTDSSRHENGERINYRIWKNYNGNEFEMSFSVTDSAALKSAEIKSYFDYSNWKSIPYYQFWGSLYYHIYTYDGSHLKQLEDSLLLLKKVHQLNDRKFMNTMVSMVQDIPYTLILGSDSLCSETNQTKPCEDSVSYGIHSPSMFMHSLRGDCDTRALLLYQLMKNLGYNPMIVVSRVYAHAMLAVDIPNAGKHVEHRGNKFYFWETTAKGWQLGILPPEVNNINNWDIALN